MGLHVVAYSKASFVTADLEADDVPGNTDFIIGPDYPERLDGLPEGIYRFDGEVFEFFAGGFHDYNTWRRQLTRLVFGVPAEVVWERPDQYGDRPFFELINFSDGEGAIGPITSRKLAQDFANHAERLENISTIVQHGTVYGTNETWEVTFGEEYANFRRAFEIASDAGFVVFC